MPDYYPLFDGTGKRVCNASGAPVFARVRAGSLSPAVSVYAYCEEAPVIPGPTAPAGNTTLTVSPTLTRSSYTSFSAYSNSTYTAWSYIGTDGSGKLWYIRGIITNVEVSYSSGFRLYVRAGVQRGVKNTGGTIVMWDEMVASWSYLTKSSGVYVPDGDYTTAETTKTLDYLGLTLNVPFAATFTES